MNRLLLIPVFFCAFSVSAQKGNLKKQTLQTISETESKCINWRRDFHQHPELGNREYRTTGIISAHLKKLGLEVTDSVAHTGVLAILRGGKPGPVIALRADIDALPVTERVAIPFASKARTTYNNMETGVMHACGHDAHTAILMAVAEVLSKHKSDLKGTIKFIFQPAEEGVPKGETGGAKQMVAEGVLKNPDAEVIFGLHTDAQLLSGQISYRPAGTMASACDFKITIKGKQTHGSEPWNGVDPVVISSYIITQLQTIVSRNVNLRENPAAVTVGSFHSGIRFNIIPETAELTGTIRALTDADEKLMYGRLKDIAESTAKSMGAEAIVEIPYTTYYPVTYNNPPLTEKMLPSLREAAGENNVVLMPPKTGAEDFSFYAKEIPGLFFFLGGRPANKTKAEAAPHHTPDFFLDESSFTTGIKAFCNLVMDYADNWKSK
jgi:amidohydrolase